jgi:zinc-ribbon domain
MTEAGIYCTQCGAKIEPTSKFCSNCGKPTSPLAAEEAEKVRRAAGGAGENTMAPKTDDKSKENKKRKGKKLKIVVGIVLGVIFVFIGLPLILMFGAPGAIPSNPDNITGVSQFFVIRDGNLYNVRFSLVDRNQSVVTSDANATFTVKSQTGATLYERAFAIKSTDFQTYQLVLTGAPIVAHAFQINSSEIAPQEAAATLTRNGTSSGGGGTTTTPTLDSGMKTAYLTVTLPNGKSFTAQTTFF